MRISELIKDLEEMLEMCGDLDVVKTGEYLGSESVDGIAWIRGHECLICNEWLDNYTMTTEAKFENVKNYLIEILDGMKCCNCNHFFTRDNIGICGWWSISVTGDEPVTESEIKISCFEFNKEFENQYEKNYELDKIQYCKGILEKEMKGNEI